MINLPLVRETCQLANPDVLLYADSFFNQSNAQKNVTYSNIYFFSISSAINNVVHCVYFRSIAVTVPLRWSNDLCHQSQHITHYLTDLHTKRN